MCGHSDYGIYNFLSLQVHICTNDLDDVIHTLISMVPKGRDGIKDISNTCNWFVMVKHIIYKHNINFPYFYNQFTYLLIVFGMNSFI
jgi:hypothetical protein